jgi:hypothetical protein
MTDPEYLILGWLEGALTEAEQAELTDWLKADAEHTRRFADAMMFDPHFPDDLSIFGT